RPSFDGRLGAGDCGGGDVQVRDVLEGALCVGRKVGPQPGKPLGLFQVGAGVGCRGVGGTFLYNMVRIIAGTLVYVGLGKLTPQDIADILNCGDRTKAGKTLPPEGLSLIKVEY
ncbi:MAG: hypothetical protein RSB59_02740, partial [Clostridia bacterium]